MSISIAAEPVPLRLDHYGTYRVGNSGVRLDTVIFAYNKGSSPEKIAQEFPTLELSDVYAVVGYYLKHKADVDGYLDEREQSAAELRKKLEEEGITPTDNGEFRGRLVERWNART
jgi:uncharacterized protein (DUF433 family)